MQNIRLIRAAVKPAFRHEHTHTQTNRQTDCIFIYIDIYIYILEICSLHSQIYSKATAPGSLIKNFLAESLLPLVLPALETPEDTWQRNLFDQNRPLMTFKGHFRSNLFLEGGRR